MTDPTPINHPGLEPQSPAAKVLDAFLSNYTCRPSNNVAFEADRNGLAAALCAVADQVVPETNQPRHVIGFELGDWDARRDVRSEILDIATELRNHQ